MGCLPHKSCPLHLPHLVHEDVEDPGGHRQREGGEEEGEEPRRGVHGGEEALGAEVNVQFRQLLLYRRDEGEEGKAGD